MADSIIDWQAPWLKGFSRHGEVVERLWRSFKSLPLALNQYALSEGLILDAWHSGAHGTHPHQEVKAVESTVTISGGAALNGLPLFVAQERLPEDIAYESFIHQTHSVPTRDNLHDFFNALCWIRFPLTKSFLNAQQALAIEQLGQAKARGALRDALTLLDENACFIWCDEPMWKAFKSHDWLSAFGTQRESWKRVRVELFGHALLEKLCNPYKAITAHALRVLPAGEGSDQVQVQVQVQAQERYLTRQPARAPRSGSSGEAQHASLALSSKSLSFDATDEDLDQAFLATLRGLPLSEKPFQALPVLGVPGWHVDNQHPSFYEDVKVFRPLRSSQV